MNPTVYYLDVVTHRKAYFDTNKAEDITLSINWAVHKTSLQGFLIQIGLKKLERN